MSAMSGATCAGAMRRSHPLPRSSSPTITSRAPIRRSSTSITASYSTGGSGERTSNWPISDNAA